MRNVSEKMLMPSCIVVGARNYQSEMNAIVVLSWTAKHREAIRLWERRFTPLLAEDSSLSSIHTMSSFEAYDHYASGIDDWIAKQNPGAGDVYDEGILLYGVFPPVAEWSALVVRRPAMITRRDHVCWEFEAAPGQGRYETDGTWFDNKAAFGPEAK